MGLNTDIYKVYFGMFTIKKKRFKGDGKIVLRLDQPNMWTEYLFEYQFSKCWLLPPLPVLNK